MQVRALAVSGVLAGAVSLALAAASPAAAVCDSYSGNCPSTPPGAGAGNTDIGGTDDTPATNDTADSDTGDSGTEDTGTAVNRRSTPSTPSTPATLPFTGGEIVLLTALGAGALAGGTALVVAGRRKSSAAA